MPHLAEQIVRVELDRLVLDADRLYHLSRKLVEVAAGLELGATPQLEINRNKGMHCVETNINQAICQKEEQRESACISALPAP